MSTTSAKNDKPLVCICIPTYNAAKTVQETLESIFAQTYSNLIIHVSDNASTDDTLKVLESFDDDPRLHIHAYDENIGGEGNFTRCIQLAEGEYTAIFHADDVYEPTMVEKQVAYLESHFDVGSVFTKAWMINENGENIGEIGSVPEGNGNVPIDFERLFKMTLRHHNFLICPSVMVRTDIYKKDIKEWGNDLFKSASDIDVWFRLSQIKSIVVLDEFLMRYRISTAQFSDRIRNRTKRTDFFLVMDYYLEIKEVKSFLTDVDRRNYKRLERHESVACAINLIKLGRNHEAKQLLNKVVCLDAFFAVFCDKRGVNTYIVGLLLKIGMTLRLQKKILYFINWIKNETM